MPEHSLRFGSVYTGGDESLSEYLAGIGDDYKCVRVNVSDYLGELLNLTLLDGADDHILFLARIAALDGKYAHSSAHL